MLIYAVIKILISLVVLISSSIFFYLSFRSYYVPRNTLLKENLYFDFSKEFPTAKIHLSSKEKQWEYSDENLKRSISRVTQETRFLNPGVSYVISVDMMLSKSNRNKYLSKFMLNMKLIDYNDTEIAYSSRPIVMPYQSTLSKSLETILFFPLRLLGFIKVSETVSVREDLMNNYREPLEATKKLEFSLSTNQADIEAVFLTIFPRFNILTRLMFYHPTLAFVCGVSIITFAEIVFCVSILSIYYFFQFLSSFSTRDNATNSEIDTSEADDDSVDSDDLFEEEEANESSRMIDNNDQIKSSSEISEEAVNPDQEEGVLPAEESFSLDGITLDIDDGIDRGLRKRK